MKALSKAAPVALALLLSVGCSDQTFTPNLDTPLRVVDIAPTGGAVDVAVAGGG